jgi:hypothetical protein
MLSERYAATALSNVADLQHQKDRNYENFYCATATPTDIILEMLGVRNGVSSGLRLGYLVWLCLARFGYVWLGLVMFD